MNILYDYFLRWFRQKEMGRHKDLVFIGLLFIFCSGTATRGYWDQRRCFRGVLSFFLPFFAVLLKGSGEEM